MAKKTKIVQPNGDTALLNSKMKQLGMTAQDLSRVSGVPENIIADWQIGRTKPDPSFIEALIASKPQPPLRRTKTKPDFRFIDLFAGIGGIRMAFEEAEGECVFTAEWNKFAQQTYKANFRVDHPIAGDITQVPVEEIPDHDVLLAGFPCQPFSIAGVSKKNALGRAHGFACQTQGTLFFDIVRILETKRPVAFVLENVKNLLSHDRGNTFRVIINALTQDLGYQVHYDVLDAKGLLPQHRERTVIVGFQEHFGVNIFEHLDLGDPLNGPRLGSVLHTEDGTESAEPPYTEGELATVGEKYILTDHLWNYLQAYAEKHRAKGNGFGFGLVGPEDTTRTLSARYFKDGSEILVARAEGNPRRLTPRECARLMGFDEPGKPHFKLEVSDTQAYKQFGNSVAVPVFRQVAKAMKPWLLPLVHGTKLPRKPRQPARRTKVSPIQLAM